VIRHYCDNHQMPLTNESMVSQGVTWAATGAKNRPRRPVLRTKGNTGEGQSGVQGRIWDEIEALVQNPEPLRQSRAVVNSCRISPLVTRRHNQYRSRLLRMVM
jgi:hypothetical protein